MKNWEGLDDDKEFEIIEHISFSDFMIFSNQYQYLGTLSLPV